MSISNLIRKKSIEKIWKDAEVGSYTKSGTGTLIRTLRAPDLTALGIAAIIGAGIFSTIGNAAYAGGPAVSILFIFTAIACGFSALCYAEFASVVPISGSAYTYAYAAFGEIVAWIIGWDLIMEYAIGNIAVAISWSDYFTGLMDSYGLHIPDYLTMDYLTASRRGSEAAIAAWTHAPIIGGIHLVCDLPALAIVFIVTVLVFIGIKKSKGASNFLVIFKVLILFFIIIIGAFYVDVKNWKPFSPNGISGVMKGVSAVFFAYIGFDAISTTAEECQNPQRDLPRGMIYSLLICTVLYVAVSLILTGMTSYKNLQVGDPLAYVFGPAVANILWVEKIIAVSAVIAMTAVLLVFQLGQPRIWMAMSRDGLLPPIFSSIHPRFRTPWFSTIVTGLVVAIPSLFMNLTEVTDLTSIGTLFAFVLVSGGVLLINSTENKKIKGSFKVPYINSKYIAPVLFILTWVGVYWFNREGMITFFSLTDPMNQSLPMWDVVKHKIPLGVYIALSFPVVYYCFVKKLSLIPVLGFMSCGYLMTELGITNWMRFLIWLVIGLILYFFYGYKHSNLSKESAKV